MKNKNEILQNYDFFYHVSYVCFKRNFCRIFNAKKYFATILFECTVYGKTQLWYTTNIIITFTCGCKNSKRTLPIIATIERKINKILPECIISNNRLKSQQPSFTIRQHDQSSTTIVVLSLIFFLKRTRMIIFTLIFSTRTKIWYQINSSSVSVSQQESKNQFRFDFLYHVYSH